jgi:hypothetical protein
MRLQREDPQDDREAVANGHVMVAFKGNYFTEITEMRCSS